MDTNQFLKLWFGESGPIGLWRKGHGAQWLSAVPTTEIKDLAPDTYFHIFCHDVEKLKELTGDKFKASRGRKETVTVIPGYALDIDIKPGAYESHEQALKEAMATEPTIIVDSGSGGLHVYYKFREPHVVDNYVGAEMALKERWMTTRKLYSAKKVDSIYDLARVLRLPGSVNSKTGRKAEVIFADHHALFPGIDEIKIAEIEEVEEETGELGVEKIDIKMFLEISSTFQDLWYKVPTDPSRACFSIAELLKGIYSPEQIKYVLIEYRKKHGLDLKLNRKDDWYRRTIGSDKTSRRIKVKKKDDTNSIITAIVSAGISDGMAIIQGVYGREIREINIITRVSVRDGVESTKFLEVLFVGGGGNILNMKSISSQSKFMSWLSSAGSIVSGMKRKQYEKIMRDILNNCSGITEFGRKDSPADIAYSLLDAYFRQASEVKDDANEPNTYAVLPDGRRRVAAANIQKWIKVSGLATLNVGDVDEALRSYGFKEEVNGIWVE